MGLVYLKYFAFALRLHHRCPDKINHHVTLKMNYITDKIRITMRRDNAVTSYGLDNGEQLIAILLFPISFPPGAGRRGR